MSMVDRVKNLIKKLPSLSDSGMVTGVLNQSAEPHFRIPNLSLSIGAMGQRAWVLGLSRDPPRKKKVYPSTSDISYKCFLPARNNPAIVTPVKRNGYNFFIRNHNKSTLFGAVGAYDLQISNGNVAGKNLQFFDDDWYSSFVSICWCCVYCFDHLTIIWNVKVWKTWHNKQILG